MKNLNERATLFKITSNAMINACTEFMELTQSQGQRLVLICISFDIRVEHHGTCSKVRSEAIFLFPSCSLFGQKWGVSCRIDTSHMIKIILKEVQRNIIDPAPLHIVLLSCPPVPLHSCSPALLLPSCFPAKLSSFPLFIPLPSAPPRPCFPLGFLNPLFFVLCPSFLLSSLSLLSQSSSVGSPIKLGKAVKTLTSLGRCSLFWSHPCT